MGFDSAFEVMIKIYLAIIVAIGGGLGLFIGWLIFG